MGCWAFSGPGVVWLVEEFEVGWWMVGFKESEALGDVRWVSDDGDLGGSDAFGGEEVAIRGEVVVYETDWLLVSRSVKGMGLW